MGASSQRLWPWLWLGCGIAACASSEPASSSPAASSSRLDGEYAASDGPIASMTFADDSYSLRRAGCNEADASCLETGKWSVNADHTELTLTPAAGPSVRYRLSVRALEGSSASTPLAPQSLSPDNGADVSATAGSQTLLSPRVSSFQLDTPGGSEPLVHVAWTVDHVEKGQLGCVCRPGLGPNCRPATISACPEFLVAYCCL